jgi:hypothetical protein
VMSSCKEVLELVELNSYILGGRHPSRTCLIWRHPGNYVISICVTGFRARRATVDRFCHRIAQVIRVVESSAPSIPCKGFHSDLDQVAVYPISATGEGAVRISIVDWSAVVIRLSGLLPGQEGPLVRYRLDFAISAQDLRLENSADGVRHRNIEVMVVAYDLDGALLNSFRKKSEIVLDSKAYLEVMQIGLQMHREIDVPEGQVLLRTGFYDLNSGKAGTLGTWVGDQR